MLYLLVKYNQNEGWGKMTNLQLKRNFLTSVAVLTAATGIGLAGSVNVHADVDNTNHQATVNDQHQTDLANAQSAVSSAVAASSVANNQLSSAQSTLSAAQSDQVAKSNAASDASTAVSLAETQLSAAQQSSGQLAIQIQAKSEAVDSQQAKVNADSTAKQNVDSGLNTAMTVTSTAQSAFEQAQSAVTSQEGVVSSATQALSEAQAALSNIDPEQLNRQLSAAQTAVDSDIAAVSAAGQDVENKQRAKSAADQAVTAASTAKDRLTTAQQSAASAASSASAAVSQAQQTVNDRQAEVDRLENASSEMDVPHFNFTAAQKTATQTFVQQLYDYLQPAQGFDSSHFSALPGFAAWKGAMTTGQDNSGWSDSNTTDQNTILDINNLTTEQATELSQFAAATINQMRQDLGIANKVGKVVVTTGMVGEANEVGHYYANRTYTQMGHYIYALKKAAYDYGLTNTDATNADKQVLGSNSYGESLSSSLSTEYVNSQISLAAVKEQIVNAIYGMLVNDAGSNMGHAESMIGAYSMYGGQSNEDFGVAMSFIPNAESYQGYSMGLREVHFIQFPSWQRGTDIATGQALTAAQLAKQQSKQINHEIPATSTSDPTAVANAQASLRDAQTDLTNKQTVANAAQQTLVTANQDLQTATAELNAKQQAATAAEAALTTAQQNLATANQQLTSDRGTISDLQHQITNSSVDQQTKQAAVEAAQHTLDQANAQLTALQSTLTDKQGALQNAKANQQTAQQAVDEAQTTLNQDNQLLSQLQEELTALQNAPQTVEEAQRNLTAKRAALVQAQHELDMANQAVTDAQQQRDRAQTMVAQANQALHDAQTRYESLQNDADRYGETVSVREVTVTVGEITDVAQLPTLTINNPTMTVTPAMNAFMSFVREAQQAVPAGTTATWSDPTHVLHDTQTVGDYTEQVTVHFSDGSTYATMTGLHVKPTQDSHGGQGGGQGQTTTPDGQTPVTPVIPDHSDTSASSADSTASSATVPSSGEGSSAVSSATVPSSDEGSSATSESNSATISIQNSGKNSNQLPQTGNNKNITGLAVLVLASAMALLGLGGRKKRHE